MNRPDLSHDDVLLTVLRGPIEQLDPVPVAAVRAAAAAWEICRADGELAELVANSALEKPLVLLRNEVADTTSLTFVASRLTVEIEIDNNRHAVGVISPPVATEIEVETSSAVGPAGNMTTRSDDLGRFRVDVATGLCRLRVGSGPEAVFTSWFYC